MKYVVRPVLPSGCESKSGQCGAIGTRDPLNLGGFGVELALKNMEYKAMDDSEIKKGQCEVSVLCCLKFIHICVFFVLIKEFVKLQHMIV